MSAVPRTRTNRQEPASIEVVPGLRVPPWVDVQVEDWRGVDLAARVTFHTGRAVLSELRVSQREGGPTVTGELLRAIPVKTLISRALRHSWNEYAVRTGPLDPARSGPDAPTPIFVAWGLLDVVDRDRMREAGPTEETLRWAALIYRVALLLGEPPTKSVAGAFEIAGSTAGQWVAAARSRGFLGAAEGPGKAGG